MSNEDELMNDLPRYRADLERDIRENHTSYTCVDLGRQLSLVSRAEAAEATVETLRGNVSMLQKSQYELENLVHARTGERDKAEAELVTLRREKQEWETLRTRAYATETNQWLKVTDLEKALRASKLNLITAYGQLEDLNVRCNKAEARAEAAERGMKVISGDHDRVEAENEQLREELKKAKEERQSPLAAALDYERTENQKLRARVGALEAAAHKALAEHEDVACSCCGCAMLRAALNPQSKAEPSKSCRECAGYGYHVVGCSQLTPAKADAKQPKHEPGCLYFTTTDQCDCGAAADGESK